ncbi:hypothetical protein [Paracoccus aerodenitrificans]|uniref:hypothetical protein n=1 Tax=Paracoccus aerodenitrificans TaxID=3017781 RepID=UPI0022F01426|nr:hypothetical protein [Paracoccus aerodenitrificans]WBU65270.1 hypothetical protein PAE61_07590 [Paracoccus aerodenitrificans]
MTVYVLLYAAFLGFGGECTEKPNCSSRLAKFAYLDFNEVGDTIAGFGSLLAFAWLIVTVMLQSQELKAQRKELQQQRLEWKKISEAQDAQVRILEKQGEIFADEYQARRQQNAKKVFDERIKDLLSDLATLYDLQVYGARYDSNQSLEQGVNSVQVALDEVCSHPHRMEDPSQLLSLAHRLEQKTKQLTEIVDQLSEDQQIMVKRLKIEDLPKKISKLMNDVAFYNPSFLPDKQDQW